jgi:hypothetical protein
MPESTTSLYLLLLRHPTAATRPSPAELEKLMAKFALWRNDMKAKGQLVSTNGLEFTGRVLRAPAATVHDGFFAETKEIIGGYVLIRARSLDDATEIAKGCPALYQTGTNVEIRPVVTRDEPS